MAIPLAHGYGDEVEMEKKKYQPNYNSQCKIIDAWPSVRTTYLGLPTDVQDKLRQRSDTDVILEDTLLQTAFSTRRNN